MKFHHLGVATANLDRERQRYLGLGYRAVTDVILDDGIGVQLQFLECEGAPRIELVAAIAKGTESPVTPWVERKIHAYHHAFEVADLDAAVANKLASGGFLVAAPQPAVAFEGRNVAFLTFTSSMLLEFIQERVP